MEISRDLNDKLNNVVIDLRNFLLLGMSDNDVKNINEIIEFIEDRAIAEFINDERLDVIKNSLLDKLKTEDLVVDEEYIKSQVYMLNGTETELLVKWAEEVYSQELFRKRKLRYQFLTELNDPSYLVNAYIPKELEEDNETIISYNAKTVIYYNKLIKGNPLKINDVPYTFRIKHPELFDALKKDVIEELASSLEKLKNGDF